MQKRKNKHKAFGEEKTLREWSQDPRCKVDLQTIEARIYLLGWEVERAIKSPCVERRPSKKYEAFGESKTLLEWTKDDRCPGLFVDTIKSRIKRGLDIEEAISLPRTRGRKASKEIEAFGETKTVPEWIKDPRCKVNKSSLVQRLARGWDPDKAITTPVNSYHHSIYKKSS